MKRLTQSNYLIFISILFVTHLLYSCSFDKQAQTTLVGRWEMMGFNTSEKIFTLCLYEDSSFTMNAPGGVPQSGEWMISQDTLKCYGKRNDYSGRTNDSYEFIFKIVRHDEHNLYLADFETRQVMELNRLHE